MSAPQEIECVESIDPVVVLTLEKAGLGDGVVSALNPVSFLFSNVRLFIYLSSVLLCNRALSEYHERQFCYRVLDLNFCVCYFLSFKKSYASQKAAKWSEQKVFVAERIKLNSQLCIAPDYSAEIRQPLKNVSSLIYNISRSVFESFCFSRHNRVLCL